MILARANKNLRDHLLSDLYKHIKINSFSIQDFFQGFDSEKKGFFTLEEFNELLKKYKLNLDNKDLEVFGEQISVNSPAGRRKITLSQLIFYSEGFIEDDLKEVKNITFNL